jgi:hypothetical protein
MVQHCKSSEAQIWRPLVLVFILVTLRGTEATTWTTAITAQNLTIAPGTTTTCSGNGCNINVQNTFNIHGVLKCETRLCKINITCGELNIGTQGQLLGGDITAVVAGSVSVSGKVSANGLGYSGGMGEGPGGQAAQGTDTRSVSYAYANGGGAGYGGKGAGGCAKSVFASAGPGGVSYGSASKPQSFGSGGGRGCLYIQTGVDYCTASASVLGGAGGGRIFINASSIHVASSAVISADGQAGSIKVMTDPTYATGGGGSGGSVWLEAQTNITGSGTVQAIGGGGSAGSIGSFAAGGGGRIALRASSGVSLQLVLQADGGAISTCAAAAGSIFVQHSRSNITLMVSI